MKSRRTKACEITRKVKEAVWERDNHRCIFCGRWVPVSNACCHVIPRSHGGLGVEWNIVTGCAECHFRLDNTSGRETMLSKAKAYLRGKYKDWNERDLIYDKYKDT